MNLYEKFTTKSHSFLFNDTNLASDNTLRFRYSLLEKVLKVIMAIDEKIRDEKLQYNINTEAAKIALPPGKIDNLSILQVKKFNLLIKVR